MPDVMRSMDATWRFLDGLGRFIRLRYFGFTSSIVLMGAAGADGSPTAQQLAGLVAAALSFHAFAYIHNDVIDLPIDRTEPARARDPLVAGTITPRTALWLAALQPPLLCLIAWWQGAPLPAYLALGAALILMSLYNLFGKRNPFPPLTDIVQGAAWSCLAIYGSLVMIGAVHGLSLIAASCAFGIILLINGIHGGLRDLRNDMAHGMLNTAMLLGARPRGAQEVESTRAVQAFAWCAFAVYVAPPTWALLEGQFQYPAPVQTWVVWLWFAVTGLSAYKLSQVVRIRQPGRRAVIGSHGPSLLMAPFILFLPRMSVPMQVTLLACFIGPMPVFDDTTRSRIRRWLQRA